MIPAILFAWMAIVEVGLFTYSYVQRALCTPDDLISGYCANEMIQLKVAWIPFAFAGLSGIAVVLASVAMAPSNKIASGWTALGIGSIAALVLAGFSGESLAAMAAGTLAATAFTGYRIKCNRGVRKDAAR